LRIFVVFFEAVDRISQVLLVSELMIISMILTAACRFELTGFLANQIFWIWTIIEDGAVPEVNDWQPYC
jgi:hypothetical protein